MSKTKNFLIVSVSVLLLVGVVGVTAQSVESEAEDFAKFNKDNALKTPKDYRKWVFIGSNVTPNDMNDGAAAFPEFHNVYIDPNSYKDWEKNHEFSDGTIIVKELVSVGTKEAPSGNGYFQGDFGGIAAMVKDTQRYADRPGGWAYFGFPADSEYGVIQENSACAACHQQNAETDQVFTQFYPVLRDSQE